MQDKTHLGFQEIETSEKTSAVSNIFSTVAAKYDLMNDLMSLGLHRIWKHITIELARIQPTDQVLDLASGTADLARKIAPIISEAGSLHLLDLQPNMISLGRDNMLNAGWVKNVFYTVGNIEQLPYPDSHFDCLTIGFGLRNVADIPTGLRECYRVLKPGGKLVVLEFSKVNSTLKGLYDWYSFNIIPSMGKYVAKDYESYQYLVESIRMHPIQETLAQMIVDHGFQHCTYGNISCGVVCVHLGYK